MSDNPVYNQLKIELMGGKSIEYLTSPDVMARLRQLTLLEREQLAYDTHSLVVYIDHEGRQLNKAEEQAVLKAAPPGYPLEALNGLNLGAGTRPVHPALFSIDLCRGNDPTFNIHGVANNVFLADAMTLPFKEASIDYIVALHVVEHLPHAPLAISNWLELLKPGGGIGLIVPDWRYTWDARKDESSCGHRMNGTPELFRALLKDFEDHCSLEALATYPYKMSFDVIIRKHGEFVPFTPRVPATGKWLAENNVFWHGE